MKGGQTHTHTLTHTHTHSPRALEQRCSGPLSPALCCCCQRPPGIWEALRPASTRASIPSSSSAPTTESWRAPGPREEERCCSPSRSTGAPAPTSRDRSTRVSKGVRRSNQGAVCLPSAVNLGKSTHRRL